MKRRVMMTLAASAMMVAGVWAQDKPAGDMTDPVEILKKVDAAAKAVKAAKYKATYKGTGAAASQRPEVEGTVLMTGWANNFTQKFYIEAKVKRPESSDVKNVAVGCDGDEYYVIDHQSKKVYADIDRMVIGRTGQPAIGLLTAEFLHPTPFSDEINAKKQELKGSEKVGDEDCYVVYVDYGNNVLESVWHFSKKDFLPRGRKNTFKLPDGSEGGDERVITDLVVDPKLDDEAFKLKVPEGYTKIDDFAP